MSALKRWFRRRRIFGIHPLAFCHCGHHNGVHWRMYAHCLECECRVFTMDGQP